MKIDIKNIIKYFVAIIFFSILVSTPSSVRAAAIVSPLSSSFLEKLSSLGVLFDLTIPPPNPNPENEILPVISRIMIYPETDQEEYFEIVNPNNSDFDLTGWKVQTASSSYILQGQIIKSGETLRIPHSISKLRFNNSGGFLKLFDPAGELKQEVNFGSAHQGQVCQVVENVCQFSDQNSPTISDQVKILNTIREAKSAKTGDKIQIKGIVTAPPDTLSKQYFYIQDETGGIQIYSYWSDFPDLESGDLIQVEGEISTFLNENRLKIQSSNDIKIIGWAKPVEPKATDISTIDKNLSGQFVTVTGRVIKKSGETIEIEKNGSNVKISIHALTNISTKNIKKGAEITVSGIVYPDHDFYKILPFESKNVKIITLSSKKSLPRAGPDLSILLISFVIWIIFLTLKIKLERSP